MKKIHTLIIFIILINCASAKTEYWTVVHTASTDSSQTHFFDDGTAYIVKPVGNGYCLDSDYPTTPSSITVDPGYFPETSAGDFKITFIGNIFKTCGYEHSSQDFEVHSLSNPSISATFEWYSPYAKSSYIKVLNDPNHIVMAVTGPMPQEIYIGKWVDPK